MKMQLVVLVLAQVLSRGIGASYAAWAASQNRTATSASTGVWVVDLGLLGPNPHTCQGVQGGPFPCPGLATSVAVQTCVGLLNRDPSVAGAAYTLSNGKHDADWLARPAKELRLGRYGAHS